MTTQYVGEAAYCDFVGVLASGRLLAFGTPDSLRRRAFAGDLLDVTFVDPPRREFVARLRETPAVTNLAWLDDHTIRLSVDDAADFTPSVVHWARQHEVEVDKTEPFLPPFDDVFVELVSKLNGQEQTEDVDETVAHAG